MDATYVYEILTRIALVLFGIGIGYVLGAVVTDYINKQQRK